jgi:hypothetical protein
MKAQTRRSTDSWPKKTLLPSKQNPTRLTISWIISHLVLKHSQGFPGINFDNKSKGNSEDSLAHNRGYSQTTVTGLQCETCLFWIDKYYTDIPILQSQIKTLTDLVDPLTDENHRLKSIVQRQGKRLKTTGNIILKNVESVTAMINSEIM